jgi:hypothetical protein
MDRISISLVVAMILLLRCSTAGQSTIESLDTQRMDVVKIRSHPSGRAAESAAGVYVGRDQQNAFFITTLHSLRKQVGINDPVDPVENVELQFYSGTTRFTATVLDKYDADIDLAVVYVPAVDLPSRTITIPANDPSALLSIHIIGHPPSGDWSVWKGAIQSETGVKNDERVFSTETNESLTKGFSGGPVLDSRGNFIGMHRGSESKIALNLKSGSILAKLRLWHVPTDNLASANKTFHQDKTTQARGGPPPKAQSGIPDWLRGDWSYDLDNQPMPVRVGNVRCPYTADFTVGVEQQDDKMALFYNVSWNEFRDADWSARYQYLDCYNRDTPAAGDWWAVRYYITIDQSSQDEVAFRAEMENCLLSANCRIPLNNNNRPITGTIARHNDGRLRLILNGMLSGDFVLQRKH